MGDEAMHGDLGYVHLDEMMTRAIREAGDHLVLVISFAESGVYIKLHKLNGLTRNNIRYRRWRIGLTKKYDQEPLRSLLWPGPFDCGLISAVFQEYRDHAIREILRDGRFGLCDRGFFDAVCGEVKNRRHIPLREEVVSLMTKFYCEVMLASASIGRPLKKVANR